jgi:hypothetical protein
MSHNGACASQTKDSGQTLTPQTFTTRQWFGRNKLVPLNPKSLHPQVLSETFEKTRDEAIPQIKAAIEADDVNQVCFSFFHHFESFFNLDARPPLRTLWSSALCPPPPSPRNLPQQHARSLLPAIVGSKICSPRRKNGLAGPLPRALCEGQCSHRWVPLPFCSSQETRRRGKDEDP